MVSYNYLFEFERIQTNNFDHNFWFKDQLEVKLAALEI
jgi:hypothetical protein